MVQLLISLKSSPDRAHDVLQALRWVRRTACLDPHARECRLLVEADHPESLVYMEVWSSLENLERRVRSAHFTHLLGVMELAAEPPLIEFRFCTSKRGLDYVEELRGGGTDET